MGEVAMPSEVKCLAKAIQPGQMELRAQLHLSGLEASNLVKIWWSVKGPWGPWGGQ